MSKYERVGFPGGSTVKNSVATVRPMSSIPGLGRSPGVGNGSPLQYSCLGNPWTEEPGGLQSTGSQNAGHSLVTKQQTATKRKEVVYRGG